MAQDVVLTRKLRVEVWVEELGITRFRQPIHAVWLDYSWHAEDNVGSDGTRVGWTWDQAETWGPADDGLLTMIETWSEELINAGMVPTWIRDLADEQRPGGQA